MATVSIKGIDGSAKGQFALAADVYEAPQNQVLVREVLNAYNQNQRQGTHSTKTRAHVSGGGKKPYAQKHTGNARQGSIRSPQFRHGAIIFGPLPRDYREKINRRKRRAALRAVLSARVAEGNLVVVDSLDFAKPNTKTVLATLDKLGGKGRVLVVTKGVNENLVLATRNVVGVEAAVSNAISVNDLLLADTVILTAEAADELGASLSPEKE